MEAPVPLCPGKLLPIDQGVIKEQLKDDPWSAQMKSWDEET